MPLPDPTTEQGRAGLAALCADPAGAVVALDFDGTLAPIVPDPAQARAHPGAAPALRRLLRRIDSVAIITGRPAGLAVEYGGLAGLDRLVVLGGYGRQRWEAGRLSEPEPPAGVAEARAALPAVLSEAGAPEGTWIEDKGQAVAVHTRRAAEPERAFALLRGPLVALAERTGLAVEPGRLVIELRPPGIDKGTALRRYLAERGARSVLFGGDDLGDVPAFTELARLREQGLPGLAVCSGSAEVTELTRLADVVVDGPAGVVALLEGYADAIGA
ncbi:trehalose-phosphatase [Allonocardiopsis opalescens]|uniref:Trehalose 6-phosphate phosphatase n=1 Tax=Allonocardiopsis opalescens TaxID=1144618 RepID=A0A2T0QA19_9ACTN|nr:trehalose-phosphatase [Allonocardiopsis opalescens]PRY00687.1 trehalose 6-phosphatase [Allonocardiopsis opalescens]